MLATSCSRLRTCRPHQIPFQKRRGQDNDCSDRRDLACLLMKGSAANARAPNTARNTTLWLPRGAFMTPCCTADLVIRRPFVAACTVEYVFTRFKLWKSRTSKKRFLQLRRGMCGDESTSSRAQRAASLKQYKSSPEANNVGSLTG